MKTFTTYAEKKAKQFLNLLQGYTRGIRITAILILLLMGVSNAWAITFSGGYVYFDNTNTNWSGVFELVAHQYDYKDYIGCTTMSKISGTNNLYYVANPNGTNWGNIWGWRVMCNASAWGSQDCSESNLKKYATHYTASDNSNGLTSGYSYLCYGANTNNNCALTRTSLGNSSTQYNSLNYTQTVQQYLSTDNGSTFAASTTSIATVKVTANKLNGRNTTTSNSGTIASGQSSATCSAARTATVTYEVSDEKPGYTFVGWYDGTTQKSTNKKFEAYQATGAKTITARFKANQYTITYKDQGGSNFSGTHESGYPTTHTYGTATTLKTASKTGYTFEGWYKESACTNKVTSLGATAYTANIPLYAKWTPITYNITYTAPTNGSYTIKVGNNAAVSANTTANYNTTITLTSNPDPGYRFSKWTITPDVSITNNNTFLMPANDVKIDATFEADTYTITWNANEGSVSPESSNYTYNGDPVVLPEPTRDGYTFLGWFTSANGGDKINDVGEDNKPTSDVEYFAQWEKNTYTVTYGVVGGENGTIALNKTSAIEGQNTQNLAHGTELTFTAEPNDGYQILGWFSDAEGNTPLGNSTANTYTITSLTGAASVFVAFEKIPASTYIVTFNANGGNGTMNSQSFTENVPQNLTTNAFTRTGYTFAGWKTAADGTGDSYTDGQSVTLTTAGLTLYAQWTADQYTITLDKQGGTGGTSEVTVHYENNDYSVNPVSVPSIQGYAFMGYYVAKNGSGFQVVDANGNWVANAHGYTDADGKWKNANNTTLYAHFQKAQIATLTLDRTQIDAGDKGYVIPSYTIAPTPAGTVVVTWQLQYSNGNSVNGHEPIIEGETVKFSVDGLAAGAYKVVATLHLGDSNGEVLHTQEVGFVMVGAYTVTVKYMFESEEIAARTTHAGHPINPNSITAPEIGGYNFVKWVLGDGISSTSTLTDKTIEYLAAYDGYLTATYEKKELIFLDLSKKFGTADWTAPHIYLYSAEFWDENKGTGATTNCVARGAMSPVPGTTGMWFYEYKDVKNFNGYVAFTPTDKMTQANFYDTEVIHRGDFSIGTPVFVPAVGQTANIKNPSEGKNAQYYNKGHWTKYMGGTGYTLKIYNHKEKEGREELMSVPFTGSSLYLPFTAVVDLEAGQTFGYKIVRDNDKWYKNDADGTMTVNSHTNWPFVEDNSDGLACGIQTVAAGIHTFTLTLDATSGNFNVSVDYPVTVGDYRILYKDDTRTTYKPSDIKKADELNPVTSFFIRPGNDPKLKVQTAAHISNGDVTWYTADDQIYFKPNENWKSAGARFAAWFNGDKWKDLNKNGDVYSCEIPSGATEVIFCRMDPQKATNNWSNKWDQTGHLTLTTNNLYTLKEGEWGNKLYLKPNSNWTQSNARFAAYFFNSNSDYAWVSMGNPVDGVYSCDIPAKVYKNVIFCRMNPAFDTNNWDKDGNDYVWDQSTDQTVPTNGNTLFTVKDGDWNNASGSWSVKEGSWSTINGSIIDLSSSLTTKLTEIKATSDAVYTIYLSANGASIEKVEPYTGNYYIRVDAADGKWYDYKTNPDNLMTYSAFSENEVAVVDGEATYKSPYSHYKTAWCKEGENVKFVIANDYSPCISDTLVQDSKFDNIDEHGNLKSGNGKYSANIRFMWNRKNNKVSRAYLAAATDQSREFLVLKSNSTLQDAEGNNIATKKVLFNDTQNWIYETTVKVQPGTHIKLYACYPTTAEADALYFRGEYASDNWDKANTSELLGGTKGDTWYTVRVIYDFKTNRLMTAWIPDNEDIEGNLAINADVMVTRSHHDDARCITFANEGSSLTEIKTVYGTLQFNRWILNNRANPQDLRVESCTKEDGNQRVFDEETTNEHHAPLPLAEQKSLYERGLYFVSFPFDVHLSDVFGFGTYGTHWVISAYNGKRRAERGYFIDNCVNDDCSNWDYIWDPDEFVMNANEGYLLSLDLDLMRYDNTNFWSNNRATVELYFPSTANVQTIKQVDYTMAGLSEDYRCNINLNVNKDNPIADRRIKDSYWRCIGVPSFADYDGANLKWTAFEDVPFIYEWNTIDNSLVPRDTKNFEFRATYAYLVQNGAEIAWSAVNAKPNQIIAKQPAEDANYDWKITIQYQDEVADHTYIRMTNKENVTHEFDFNQDLVKEFNYGRADIYTMIGYEPVAANSMPIENIATSVPLGIDIEKAGEYTIAMLEGTTSVGVTLVDIETGQRTNLAAGMEYTVYLAKGKHNERFMIEISPVNNAPTDIDQLTGSDLNANGVQKYIIDGKLIIRTAEGEVFDAQGHRL